jgi:hypothetical protein
MSHNLPEFVLIGEENLRVLCEALHSETEGKERGGLIVNRLYRKLHWDAETCTKPKNLHPNLLMT